MFLPRWSLVLILSCAALSIFVRAAATAPNDPASSSNPAATPANLTPSCDDDSQCAQLAIQAREKSQTGHMDEAQRAYEAAYMLRKDPKLLYNRARVLHKAGRFTDAETVYQQYLDAGAEGSEELRRKVQEYIQEVRREAAAEAAQRAALAQAAAKEREGPTPVYKKWWLWTAVGVAAAGLAVGIGLGVASRRPDLTDAAEARPFL